jgi:uncharacterized BrkB/YihY/UPF0761 family membrane protein
MIWVYYSTQILLFGAEITAARWRLHAGREAGGRTRRKDLPGRVPDSIA